MRGHKRNCRCCRSAACSLLLLLLLSCWLPAATPASPPSFSAAAAHLLASALSLCLFLFSSLLPVFSLLLVLALYGAAAAGVAGCWGDCLLLLVLPRALLLLLPASPPPPASPSPSPSPLPWLLLLCCGCSAGAGKGNQRHLDTVKEQTGTRLSTKKRKVRQRISFSCSFVGRALYPGGGENKEATSAAGPLCAKKDMRGPFYMKEMSSRTHEVGWISPGVASTEPLLLRHLTKAFG